MVHSITRTSSVDNPTKKPQQKGYSGDHESTAQLAMGLLRVWTDNTNVSIKPTLLGYMLDSRYQLSFEEFKSLDFKANFYHLFLNLRHTQILPSKGVFIVLQKTKTRIQRVFAEPTHLKKFKKNNSELYQVLSSYLMQNSEKGTAIPSDDPINQEFYQAYMIMLRYPEVKSNRMLFA